MSIPTIPVPQDQAVKYSCSPGERECYYTLNPCYEGMPSESKEATHSCILLPEHEEKEPVVLVSTDVHACHIVIVRDIINNFCFMLHVSAQSFRHPYDPINRQATPLAPPLGLAFFTGSGSFAMDEFTDFGASNVRKPAYVDCDGRNYTDSTIGIPKNAQLEIIVFFS